MKTLLLIFLATIFVSCANQQTLQGEKFDKDVASESEAVNHSESILTKKTKSKF